MPMKFLFVLIAFLGTSFASVAQDNEAKVSIKNETYNMGKVAFGKPVEYWVEVTNTSKETLKLEGVRAGCGCTTPDFTPNQTFKPGETVKIKIQFNGSVLGKFTRFTDIIISGGLVKQTSFTGEGVQ
ncbi:MAG: hypothetical protein B7Y11_03220 [Sphingobacteriia bacterium 24-36-13]|nr:MAG: hypothetical protein B7Y66_00460 [Sphingobacteriia bacterium 35-36-14]OYZ54880.1 MAG: hypothetical protein B7Y11_03220 [Sphingobacteriia bacterium 24-36-13]OZA66171.1 MAG: hypothetical protein B7X68_01775 [Sphingobacteriia bacterium 39-36-14]